MRSVALWLTVAAASFMCVSALFGGAGRIASVVAASPLVNTRHCEIKGNINFHGERIYHLPGDPYYNSTIIDPLRGERWFCTAQAAQAAGFRPSMS